MSCRDRPEKKLVFKIARKEGLVEVPMITELDADGDGKIGAQLATYAKLSRKAASGPVQAAGKAGREFVRMVQLVGQGQALPAASQQALKKSQPSLPLPLPSFPFSGHHALTCADLTPSCPFPSGLASCRSYS